MADKDFYVIHHHLSSMEELRKLQISENEITNDSLEFFKNILSSPSVEKNLLELNLSYNNFGTKFVREILKHLRNYCHLKIINLRGNKISKEGINHCLEFLDLNQNILGMDVSENPGFTKQISKLFLEKFIQNKELF